MSAKRGRHGEAIVTVKAADCALPPVDLVLLYLRGPGQNCDIRLIVRQPVEIFSWGVFPSHRLPDDLLSETEQVRTFKDQRGTAEQIIKREQDGSEADPAVMPDDGVGRGSHPALCPLGMFLQRADLPDEVATRPLTSLQTQHIKISIRVERRPRSITFMLAEVAIPRLLFQCTLDAIHRQRPSKSLLREQTACRPDIHVLDAIMVPGDSRS